MSYFYNKFSKDALNKAYELLEDVTPLEHDCGFLCDAGCCKGGDSDGMILFPCECEYFEKLDGFTVTHNSEYGYDCLVCSGSCNRKDRPLSCRIFPYFPYLTEKGEISAAPDVRAIDSCPMITEKYEPSKEFLRRVRMCGAVLLQDGETAAFLKKLSVLFLDLGGIVR